LKERSFEELMWLAVSARAEGLAVMRDRDGLRHGVWLHGGYVLGVHVAGRFDPLLDLLRQRGALDAHAYRACVEALWRTPSRSGAIAMELAGVARPAVRDALKTQASQRMAALLRISLERGHDACFEACEVPVTEVSVRMPLGALLRQVPEHEQTQVPALRCETQAPEARRKLRELAKRMHPDLHPHLDPEQRRALERDFARATAAYHGFV
jgi:hypothetical protein